MKDLKLESIEIKNNTRWLNGKQNIESYNYIDKDINTDEEKNNSCYRMFSLLFIITSSFEYVK